MRANRFFFLRTIPLVSLVPSQKICATQGMHPLPAPLEIMTSY